MYIFEVHSNESACRKKVRVGLEQVLDTFWPDNCFITKNIHFCSNFIKLVLGFISNFDNIISEMKNNQMGENPASPK